MGSKLEMQIIRWVSCISFWIIGIWGTILIALREGFIEALIGLFIFGIGIFLWFIIPKLYEESKHEAELKEFVENMYNNSQRGFRR